jgi:hypothetical protein
MTEGIGFGLLGGDTKVTSGDYKSAGSHQNENLHYVGSADGNWHLVHTVTAEKTYYVSSLMITTIAASMTFEIGTGNAGAEVAVMQGALTNAAPILMAFPTPIKFSSGTKISFKIGIATSSYCSLIGWEE